jgi:MFS family permease
MDDDPALGDRRTSTDGQSDGQADSQADGQADGQAAPEASHPTLRRWRDPQVVGLALMAMSAGFGQFGVVAALGDVARTFGRLTSGASLADQAGLSGTKLGLGLAIIRLASLAGLPLAGLADRVGRRKTLIAFTAIGLAITVVSAASPGYWWFVVIFSLGRPMLSATNALAGVSAAEETSSRDRAKAVALIAAGYGIGTGSVAFIHGLLGSQLGFRGVVGLAVVPLALLPLVARRVEEPDRFARQAVRGEHGLPVLGAIAPAYRRRLVIVSIIAFALSIITGPANSFVYLYAENVVHVSGAVTSAMVAAAGVTGLCGLLLGRSPRPATDDGDRHGRHGRPRCAHLLRLGGRCRHRLRAWRPGGIHDRACCGRLHQRAVPDVGAGLGGRLADRRRHPRGRHRTVGLRSDRRRG